MHRLGVALATALYLTGTADAEFRAGEPVTTPSSPYEVEGVALGSNIKSLSVYREYTCVPSEQFSGLTWCQKSVREKDRRGSFEVTSSILHRRDGTVVYVNRNQHPAVLDPHEADRIVEKYSRTFAEPAQSTRMPRQSTSDAILATWGKVELQPLDNEGVRRLAEGKSPRKGLLLDFIGNFTRSAKEGLPIYRIVGGAGFVWAGSFDRKGRGTVRFSAVDASATEPEAAATRSASALPDLPHDEPPRSESKIELAVVMKARKDAEEVIARLQSELATVLQDKQNAELARTRAEKKAQQAMTDAEIARRDLKEATAGHRAAAARDQIDLGGDGSSRSGTNILMIIGIAGTAILLVLSWILSKISAAPPEEAARAEESDIDWSTRPRDADETAKQVMPSAAEAKIDIDQDDLINELAERLGLDLIPDEALADAGREDRAASRRRHTELMSGDERPASDGSDEPISTGPPDGDRETVQTVALRILHHFQMGTIVTQPRS